MEHKFITLGEIMLRLTPPDYEKIRNTNTFDARYGGSEANIAISLANLGIDSTYFTVVPDNSLGKSAIRMLKSNDINCDPVIFSTPEEIDEILEKRRKNWKPREMKYKKGVLRMFSQHATSPMKGAYLEY